MGEPNWGMGHGCVPGVVQELNLFLRTESGSCNSWCVTQSPWGQPQASMPLAEFVAIETTGPLPGCLSHWDFDLRLWTCNVQGEPFFLLTFWTFSYSDSVWLPLSDFKKSLKKINFKALSVYVCMSMIVLVSLEAKRGCHICWNWGCRGLLVPRYWELNSRPLDKQAASTQRLSHLLACVHHFSKQQFKTVRNREIVLCWTLLEGQQVFVH